MATQKPISTISYNSESFLREKLEALYSAHIIQAYQYICHKGEDGDKDHIHLRLEPNKRVDPMDLKEEFNEYVQGSDKPLVVRPFRPSKEEDWFLYAVHDPDYLRVKYRGGEDHEKLPYDWKDIKVPDGYDLEVAFIRAKASLKHTTPNMAAQLKSGANPVALIEQGANPFTVNALCRALADSDYKRLMADYVELQKEIDGLHEAILNAGFEVISYEDKDFCFDDGRMRTYYILKPLDLDSAYPDPADLLAENGSED